MNVSEICEYKVPIFYFFLQAEKQLGFFFDELAPTAQVTISSKQAGKGGTFVNRVR